MAGLPCEHNHLEKRSFSLTWHLFCHLNLRTLQVEVFGNGHGEVFTEIGKALRAGLTHKAALLFFEWVTRSLTKTSKQASKAFLQAIPRL